MIIDSSSLIIFGKLNRLDLLRRVLGTVCIPPAVYLEVVEDGKKIQSPEVTEIDEYIMRKKIQIKELKKKGADMLAILKMSHAYLGLGEMECISLALQEQEKELILDDQDARKVSGLLGIRPHGSLWILMRAFEKRFLTEDELKNLVNMISTSNFRVGADIITLFWSLFDTIKKRRRFKA